MAMQTAIIFGFALFAAVIAFFAGRVSPRSRRATTKDVNEISAVEFVRLQERERALREQVESNKVEFHTLVKALELRSGELSDLRSKSSAGEERIAALQGQVDRAGDHITNRDRTIAELRSSIEQARAQLGEKDSALAGASEREAGLHRMLKERDEQLRGLQEQLRTEFENIANRVLAATANQLSATSQASLGAILNPLKDKLHEFQEKVEATHLEDTRQRATIAEHIRNVAQTGQSIGLQAENLTKALKGDSQLRGRWGEMQLERILESAGLERGREFVVQGGDFNLKGENGGSRRPDVIILLPEGRHFVIDSKLSLVDYYDYEAAESDEARAVSLKKLIGSVRAHADSLAAKQYQTAHGLNAHDLVMMFVPIEGVAALVLKNDADLCTYTWNKRVVLVSPATLFMTMQTVASVWRYERQNERAHDIALQAGQLYDKLVGFVLDLNEVSQKIQAASDAHGEAMKKLAVGRGNALSKAEKLKTFGVAPKKDFPAVLLGADRRVVEADDDEPRPYIELGASRFLEAPAGQKTPN